MADSYEINIYQKDDGSRPYIDWLTAMRDVKARLAVTRRISRMTAGNFGDHKSLKQGLWELRIDVGAGYRVYYCIEGTQIILLLCGGDKDTQTEDIARARLYKADYEQR